MTRTLVLRGAAVEREVLVVRRLHEGRQEVEDLERHREDEDLVALVVPELEELAQDLREHERTSGGAAGTEGEERRGEERRRTFHLPQRSGSRAACGPGLRFSQSSGNAVCIQLTACS